MKALAQSRASSEFSVEPWETLLGSTKLRSKVTGHFDATTLDEASCLLRANEEKGARVIGGGTDILRMVRQKYIPSLPQVLVNIKTIRSLAYIKEENGILEIGALTRLSDIESSELIKTKCSILVETASVVGSPQVRNMATIAGSICQDLSCWYYRAGKNYYHCSRKGGTNCPAKGGDNRWMFSIFGTPKECECYATCQSDMATTLFALSASLKTTKRIIPIEQFYTPTFPGNILGSDEIIVGIQTPVLSADTTAKYSKFSIRRSLDHPLVSVACVANNHETRIIIGGVSMMPHRANKAEDIVRGKKIDRRLAKKAGGIAVSDATPLSMNTWKVEVTKTLVERIILAVSDTQNPNQLSR